MIKRIYRYLFPKWKYIYKIETYKFEGVKLQRAYEMYREHPIHHRIQGFMWDSQGGCWSYLSNDETNVIKKLIKIGTYTYNEGESND